MKIMDIYYEQIILCVLITLVSRCYGQSDPFTVKPVNTYGIFNHNVTLQCAVDTGEIYWIRPDGNTVADSDGGVKDEYNGEYTLTNQDTTWTLTVLNVAADDAGQYQCNHPRNNAFAYAEVIWLDKDQLDCTETSENTGDFGDTLEGEWIRLECQIGYSGLWAPIQDWVWSDQQMINPSNLTIGNVVSYYNQLTSDRDNDNKHWIVTVRFPAPYDGTIPDDVTDTAPYRYYSRATPMFEYTYYSTVFIVIHGPDTMSLSPIQEEYNPGDTITCAAEGNPDPDLKWVDQANATIENSGTLLIEPGMEGQRTFSCMATNVVRGQTMTSMAEITFNVTILPTTTTTTTQAPDEGTRDPGDGSSTDSSGGLSDGAIAGIVIGVLVFLIILAIILFFCCVRKAPQKQKEKSKPMPPVSTINADHIRSGPPKPADNLSYVSEKPSPYSPYSPYAIPNSHQPPSPYEPNNLHYADLALDDTPRSRKPIQLYTHLDQLQA